LIKIKPMVSAGRLTGMAAAQKLQRTIIFLMED
jgi:hypothetical protein